MFGLIKPCRHVLDGDSYARWQAHLCGLCLTLGARDGQWTRALTNTDAVALSVLVEAQQRTPPQRVVAGRCPGRNMRSVPVVPPEALSVRLGATTSLTLASAKVADGVTERQAGLGPTGRLPRVRERLSLSTANILRRKAIQDAEVTRALPVSQMLQTLSGQAALEAAFRPGQDPTVVTTPAAEVTAEAFASSAQLTGRPENTAVLREMGSDFGTLAHLLDAVADQDADRAAGKFNPVTMAGWPIERVRAECDAIAARLRTRVAALVLQDGRLATWLFTVAITRAVVHTFAAAMPGSPGPGPDQGPLSWEGAEVPDPGKKGKSSDGGGGCCECCDCCDCCDCDCGC